MSDHDPDCPLAQEYVFADVGPFAYCQCGLIRKVRTDEQAKAYGLATRMVLRRGDYLREKVEALPQAKVAGVLYAVDDVVLRADVLKLLNGDV